MRIVDSFPRKVTEIENSWIPLPDGCRLAARIWLPEDAESSPVPAIIEYIPYRKRDNTRWRDEPMHRYFAGHGYASVRIDVRGSGESDGLLLDEYLEQEQEDGLAAIRWIAEQPWCTGAVGMMGLSWGGFNSLQIAALRPPQLKAVIAVCAADDRYTDDAHYMGGCLLNENLIWGSLLFTLNALPPDPELVGERWREMWRERLEATPLFPEIWLKHQRHDEYWKRGSVGVDPSRIACPVYAISGWADGYTNAVPRLLARLNVPRKGLVGPWAHVYPHEGVPGPAIGFLQEALRWWDRWLKGAYTGIMDEPMYRVWMQESVEPRPQYDHRPGRWVAESGWPSERIDVRRWHLQWGRLSESPRAAEPPLRLATAQTTGEAAGEWCAFGSDGEMPRDQRPDDGRSLVFDGAPLAERLEILGEPVIHLELESDVPVALLAARLNDVAPGGASTRVSYGLLNLTHRESHESPRPLEPGRRYRVRVPLNHVAHSFCPGHRLRLALSTAYWPIAWPPPQPAVLRLWPSGSGLDLPVRPPGPEDERLRPFDPPEAAPGEQHRPLRPFPFRRVLERDLVSGEVVYTLSSDGGEFGNHDLARIEAIGMELGYRLRRTHRIEPADPLSASSEITQTVRMQRPGWSIRVDTSMRLTAASGHLRLEATLTAHEGERQICDRKWDLKVTRRLF